MTGGNTIRGDILAGATITYSARGGPIYVLAVLLVVPKAGFEPSKNGLPPLAPAGHVYSFL